MDTGQDGDLFTDVGDRPSFAADPDVEGTGDERVERADRSFSLVTGIIEAGQAAGEIRPGAAPTLLHFYMTLVYEQVFFAVPDNPAVALTAEEFHDLIDGALRGTRS